MKLHHIDSEKTLLLIENVTFIIGRETLHKVFGVVDMCVSRRHVEIAALNRTKWRATCLSSSNQLRAFPDGKRMKLVKQNESVVLSSKDGYFYLYGSKHKFSLSFAEDENLEPEKESQTPKSNKIKEICVVVRHGERKCECVVATDKSVEYFVKIIETKFEMKFVRGLVCRGRNIPIQGNQSIQDVQIEDGDVVDVVVSNEEEDGDVKCAICLNDIKMSEKRGALPCNHIFHIKCIMTWSKIDRSCPLCKKQFGHIESFTPGDDNHETIEIRSDTSAVTTTAPTYEGCVRCQSGAREDVLLICDLCGDYWHTYCVGLDAVPDGDFYCPRCDDTPEPVNTQISDEDYVPSANLEEEEEDEEEEGHEDTSFKKRKRRKRVVDSDDDSEFNESIDDDDEDESIGVMSSPQRSRKSKKKKLKKKQQLSISTWITKRR